MMGRGGKIGHDMSEVGKRMADGIRNVEYWPMSKAQSTKVSSSFFPVANLGKHVMNS